MTVEINKGDCVTSETVDVSRFIGPAPRVEVQPLRGIDLYCGAGGMTTGAQQSGHVRVDLAVNHWRPAILTHSDNHPLTRHICAEMEHVDPFGDRSLPEADIIMAGVECTHHSNAKGGAPVSDQKRSSARNVLDWVRAKRPQYLIVENVREFRDWGPTKLKRDKHGKKIWDSKHDQWAREADPDHKGEHFLEWIKNLEAEGYRVEHRLLNAADYGEATKRIRLFVIARLGPGPIPWPASSHAQVENGKPRWRAAAEIIDWERNAPSIFGRKRPLAEKTLRRIKIGLWKFCVPQTVSEALERCGLPPFLVKLRGTGLVSPIGESLPTITAGGTHLAIAKPFIVKYHSGHESKWLHAGTASANIPLPTIDTNPRFAIAQPFMVQTQGPGVGDMRYAGVQSAAEPLRTILARINHGIATPFIVPNFGERNGQEPRSHSVYCPLPTVTGHGAGCLVQPFLVDPNWQDNRGGRNRVHDIRSPLGTITTCNQKHVAIPFLLPRQGFFDAHKLKRCRSIQEPLNTITAGHVPAHLVVPYLVELNHGDGNRSPGGRIHGVDGPLGTITGKRAHGLIMPEPFIVKYFGTGGNQRVSEPLSTVTTKHRHGLTTMFGESTADSDFVCLNEFETDLYRTMLLLGIHDIGFRMLDVDELARAMGLPDDYVIHGNKAEQIKQIGNMVCVRVMKAICESIGEHEMELAEAA